MFTTLRELEEKQAYLSKMIEEATMKRPTIESILESYGDLLR